jgi:flagellar motor switch protein FliM
MEKVLNQEEIDAMVRASRGGAQPSAAPHVSAWDVMKAAQVRQEQMRALDQVHEGFARALAEALSGYWRVSLGVALVSAEYLPYGDFLQRFPDGTYLASCKLSPVEEIAIMELDSSLAGPFVDLLLGGQGEGVVSDHEITEVEEQILAAPCA